MSFTVPQTLHGKCSLCGCAQSRRRPKRARSTLPRAPPSPLPSPVIAKDDLTNEETTAAAAIAALGELPALTAHDCCGAVLGILLHTRPDICYIPQDKMCNPAFARNCSSDALGLSMC